LSYTRVVPAQPSNSGVRDSLLCMRVSFRLLDVFAQTPFAGNQLCVVAEPPPGLNEATMLTVTREIGFSETAFVTAVREDGYDVRIFTPAGELRFAGHPTLGTAFTLVSMGAVPSTVVQTSAAGHVPVEVDLAANWAVMTQLPPEFGPAFADRAAVAEAAGLGVSDLVDELPVVSASTGIAHAMVPVRDEAALRRAERDGRRCPAVCHALGTESLYLFAVRSDGDLVARMFDVSNAIGEDPATGSAAGPLGAYLARHALAGMPGSVTVAQGEMVDRPSLLEVEATSAGGPWSIRVGGGVWIVGEGSFDL
jgi:trans-2,3-dihydro-3-hydroxyanthranilate isomerase